MGEIPNLDKSHQIVPLNISSWVVEDLAQDCPPIYFSIQIAFLNALIFYFCKQSLK